MSVAERHHGLPELRRSRDLGEERRIGEYYCLPAEAPALWAEADRLFEVWPGGVRLPGPVKMRANPEVGIRESLAPCRARHPPPDLFGQERMLALRALRDPVAERIDVDPPAALVVGGSLRGHLEGRGVHRPKAVAHPRGLGRPDDPSRLVDPDRGRHVHHTVEFRDDVVAVDQARIRRHAGPLRELRVPAP